MTDLIAHMLAYQRELARHNARAAALTKALRQFFGVPDPDGDDDDQQQ